MLTCTGFVVCSLGARTCAVFAGSVGLKRIAVSSSRMSPSFAGAGSAPKRVREVEEALGAAGFEVRVVTELEELSATANAWQRDLLHRRNGPDRRLQPR